MKPFPQYDFPVGVWRETRERPPAARDAYEGMYSIILNHLVYITVVPPLDRSAPWPPTAPDDIDNIADPATARRTAVWLGGLIVTPDVSRAGTMERVDINDDTRATIFYISPAEFEAISQELDAVATRMSGVHDAIAISTLRDQTTAKLLLERIVPSGALSAYALEMLGRKPDGRGTDTAH